MKEIKITINKIREEVNFENVPSEEWVSETERRLRNSLQDAVTLPARAAGYTWGRRDENARLNFIITKLTDALEKAVEQRNDWIDFGDQFNKTQALQDDAEVIALLEGK